MAIQYKAIPFEIKEVNLETGTFSGYAAFFNNIDSYKDIIMPGAFKKTLQEFSHRIKVLWQHDPYMPIGRPMEMEEDEKGLLVKAKISETSIGKDVLILLRDKVITELSIGYSPIKELFDNTTGVRTLTELKLWEFSPVTWGANDMAVITGVKSGFYGQLSDIANDIKDLKALKKEPPESKLTDPDYQSVRKALGLDELKQLLVR